MVSKIKLNWSTAKTTKQYIIYNLQAAKVIKVINSHCELWDFANLTKDEIANFWRHLMCGLLHALLDVLDYIIEVAGDIVINDRWSDLQVLGINFPHDDVIKWNYFLNKNTHSKIYGRWEYFGDAMNASVG